MTSLPRWCWWLFIFWTITAPAAGIFGVTLPLLESLGYEYSLFASLLCSLAAGQLAACTPSRLRGRTLRLNQRLPILAIYLRAVAPGLLIAALLLIVSLGNGLRVPFCNIREGLAFYLLMPISAVLIAAAIGLALGLATTGSRLPSLLYLLLYGIGLFSAVMSFHGTPAVYVFNPFFGYFPGVLYDRLVQVELRLVTYRVTTCCQILSILSVIHLLLDRRTMRLKVERGRLRSASGLFATATIILTLTLQWMAPALGHRITREDLEHHLSRHVTTSRLDLFFPEATSNDVVEALTADAGFSLSQVERFLKIRGDRRIAVFFFADSADKGRTIGAADTNVAKPWRNEVYVILDSVPHEVLRHELVHAVTGVIGRGPFAVPSEYLGLFPNPGLIEGVAMAAGGPRGDLTLHQWTAAMLSSDLLPALRSLFSLDFLNLSAKRAYTAAGSFCLWLRDVYGPEVLTSAYRTADVEGATGRSYQQLESDWRAFLKTIPANDADIAAARYFFDRPSVIGTACVHEVERICTRARFLFRIGEHAEALSLYEAAHNRSNRSTATKREWFYALADAGDSPEFHKRAEALMKDPSIGMVDRYAIREILADRAVMTAPSASGRIFEELARRAKSATDRRRLEVKSHLTRLDPLPSKAVFDILALRPSQRAASPALVALTIADSALTGPEDPVLFYLYARQYFLAGEWAETLRGFDTIDLWALAEAAPSLEVAVRMMRGQSLFHLGRLDEARFVFRSISKDPSVRLGHRAIAADWGDRVDFTAER